MAELNALVLYTEAAGKGRPAKLVSRLEKELTGHVHVFEDTAKGLSQATAAADREDLHLFYLDLDSAHTPGFARMFYVAQPYVRIVLLAEGDKEEALRELHAVAVIPRSPSRAQLRETLPVATAPPEPEPEVEDNVARMPAAAAPDNVIEMPRPAEAAEAAYADSGMPMPEPAPEPEVEAGKEPVPEPEPAPEPELVSEVAEEPRAPSPAIDWKRRRPMVAAALIAALLVLAGALFTGNRSGEGQRAALTEDKGFESADAAWAQVLGMLGGGEEAEAVEELAVPEPPVEELATPTPETGRPPVEELATPTPEQVVPAPPPAPAPEEPNRSPTCSISGPSQVNRGQTVTYTASGSDPDVDDFTLSWTSRTMEFTVTGAHTLSVTITDSRGASSSASKTVQVI